MEFANVYEDAERAAAYAKLEFPGTYYLAFRDLPAIIAKHVRGTHALDFGCGAGRSTRFLRKLGFSTVGVDISAAMLQQAQVIDAGGDYRLVERGDLKGLESGSFDFVLAAFTFDNIPSFDDKVVRMSSLKRLLAADGKIVNLVSSPEIYLNEWASFSTKDYPENRHARCGDKVRIVMLDVEDKRPVEDIVWTEEGWRDVYASAGLQIVKTYKPLGDADDGKPWVSESEIAPWTIYVVEPASRGEDLGARQ